MATLIGRGSHARDIGETTFCSRSVGHHSAYTDDGLPVVIGVNDPRERARISGEIGVRDRSWVHPRAYVGPDCDYGYGTHINYGAAMTRTQLGRWVTVSPGVTICGDVVVGDRVLLGAGAVICDRVTIGDDATVGAGAVVLPETVIPAGETWVGVPAHRV